MGASRRDWAARIAAWGASSLAVLFAAFLQESKHLPILAGANPFAEDPYDAVSSIAFQVGLVVAGVTALRAWRYRREANLPERPRTYLVRGAGIVILVVAVSLAADWIGIASTGDALMVTPLVAVLAALTGLTGLGAIAFASATLLARGRSLGQSAGQSGETDDSLDDLFSVAQETRDRVLSLFPRLRPWWEEVVRTTTRPWLAAWIAWFNPRRHLVRSVLLAATASGVALAVTHALIEGASADLGLALQIAAFFIFGETIAACAGYALLGRFLGIIRLETGSRAVKG